MTNLFLLFSFIFIEGSTIAVSKYMLQTSNKKLLRVAANMGYRLNNYKYIFDTFSLVDNDKILKFLMLIPIINMLSFAYRVYVNPPNNKKIISTLIKNKDLVEMNQVEKEYYKKHKRVEDLDLIQERKIIIFPNVYENPQTIEKERDHTLDNSKSADVINLYDLRNAISNITRENIDENEKNQKIISLLRDYGIIPNNEKVKKIRRINLFF